jgi:hypothetical protein
MADNETTDFWGNMTSTRPKSLGALTGPIPFMGLVVMVCELSLGMSNTFVTDMRIQWFLCVSMVLIFSASVAGFIYLIIFHHEKLYPPPSYPANVVKDVFVRTTAKKRNKPNTADVVKFVEKFITSINNPYPLQDLITFIASHFECTQDHVRNVISTMCDKGTLCTETQDDIVYAILPNTNKKTSTVKDKQKI